MAGEQSDAARTRLWEAIEEYAGIWAQRDDGPSETEAEESRARVAAALDALEDAVWDEAR